MTGLAELQSLEYGRARRFQRMPGELFVNIVVSSFVLAILLVIEFLNWRAGNVLPKHDVGSWKSPIYQSETSWRYVQSENTSDPSWIARPLSTAEAATMRREISIGRAEAALLTVVGTAGVAQYALAPTLVLLSISIIARARDRRAIYCGISGMFIGVLGAFLMINREYWSSLGWLT